METKKIYRLEYKDYGVYRCTFTDSILMEIRNRMIDIHSNEHTHPNLYADFDKNIIHDIYFAEGTEESKSFSYRFGCDSMEKLVKWFGSFFDELVNNGVQVKEYTIPSTDVYESNSKKQVLFKITNKVNLRTLKNEEIQKYLQKDLVV